MSRQPCELPCRGMLHIKHTFLPVPRSQTTNRTQVAVKMARTNSYTRALIAAVALIAIVFAPQAQGRLIKFGRSYHCLFRGACLVRSCYSVWLRSQPQLLLHSSGSPSFRNLGPLAADIFHLAVRVLHFLTERCTCILLLASHVQSLCLTC